MAYFAFMLGFGSPLFLQPKLRQYSGLRGHLSDYGPPPKYIQSTPAGMTLQSEMHPDRQETKNRLAGKVRQALQHKKLIQRRMYTKLIKSRYFPRNEKK